MIYLQVVVNPFPDIQPRILALPEQEQEDEEEDKGSINEQLIVKYVLKDASSVRAEKSVSCPSMTATMKRGRQRSLLARRKARMIC